jgi:glycosyltransferase involved in cell wall biosynthesis
VTGLIVPPRDPRALAEAINRLEASPDLRAQYGAAGRARVESQFTLSAMARATTALYREVLDARD